MQFRVSTEDEIKDYDYPDEAIRGANKEFGRKDRETLVGVTKPSPLALILDSKGRRSDIT